jgi:hypothetical protein
MNILGGLVRALRVLLGVFALMSAACSAPEMGEVIKERTEAATVTIPATLTVALPANLAVQSTPLAATRSLRIADRASILNKNVGNATIVNTGSGFTQLGTAARTGSIWSGGKVTLAAQATVDGFIKSAAGIQRDAGSVVTGTTDGAATLSPARESTWQVTFPANAAGDVDVQPNGQRSAILGGYGAVSVKSGGKLTLSGGTYGFEALTLEPGSSLILDDHAAPVLVYVRGAFVFRGRTQKQDDPESTKPQLLIVAFGGASIEAPFKGHGRHAEGVVGAPTAERPG